MKINYNGKYYLGDIVVFVRPDSGNIKKAQIKSVDINATTGECRYYMDGFTKDMIISDTDIIRLDTAGIERILGGR